MNGKSTLLAFDTATEYCSVALAVGDNIYQRTEKLGNGHSEALLPWIDDLSKEAGISLQALDGIIFSAGPGSFTVEDILAEYGTKRKTQRTAVPLPARPGTEKPEGGDHGDNVVTFPGARSAPPPQPEEECWSA